MSRDAFFDWAEAQDERYEFDGVAPVLMTGGSINHSRTTMNLHVALRSRLPVGGCEPLGPDAGVSTIGDRVRYPDALVTCSAVDGTSRLVPGVVVIFEVLSPTSGRIDRIVKLREYAAVVSIRRYVILEYAGIGASVFARDYAGQDWRATALTAEDALDLPEIGISIPMAELYEHVDLPDEASSG